MDQDICRVTEPDSRLTAEIGRLLERTGQGPRNAPGGVLFAAFGPEGELTGISGGRRIETDALIRFVAVVEERRHKGIGSALLSRVLSCFADGCETAWVLASRGTGEFFTRFGFEPVRSDMLPAHLRESRDLKDLEIAATEIFRLELPKRWPIL
ncbi:MAG TPA: GNAT family N-acetyltransferase [Candidatus Krumholzibacterium sp.]|nr:GNAT family N-acetyltransferase [Candidatus Krumholzibacterium sp.]